MLKVLSKKTRIGVLATYVCMGVVVDTYAKEVEELSMVKIMIVREANRIGVPPSLALSIAHVESNFSVKAKSSKGARGLMQIMPATAWGEYGIYADELWDPVINVRVGLSFLRQLLGKYRGNTRHALSYYNGGSATGEWPHARVLPYTSEYVDRVLQFESNYQIELSGYR
jgi:soluble lytic murein transglycosylase-like protein